MRNQVPGQICEWCGAPASGIAAAVPPNRGGLRPRPSEHRYCRACATAEGVPIPSRGETPLLTTEPEPPRWSDVERYLASYEGILRDDPSVRDQVRSFARQLRSLTAQLPDPMPAPVQAAFERLEQAGSNEG